jgi:two-component system, sensor histidine kinase and response regulator
MSNVPIEKASVLVIDDEESMREACARVLIREGYQVRTAANGEEGLALVKESTPDIVFVDLAMPKLAGLEVLDELATLAPESIKVVITAYATVSAALEAVRHGAYDFLPKPFTPGELRVIAARALERRSLVLKNQQLATERDQAKLRFMQFVTREVRGPINSALANLHQLDQMLSEDAPAQELAQEAVDRLERLLSMLDRWNRNGPQ